MSWVMIIIVAASVGGTDHIRIEGYDSKQQCMDAIADTYNTVGRARSVVNEVLCIPKTK